MHHYTSLDILSKLYYSKIRLSCDLFLAIDSIMMIKFKFNRKSLMGWGYEMTIKQGVIFVAQLVVLWAIHIICSWVVDWLSLPIPGNVLGMIVLFLLLMTGMVKLEWIHDAASFLLKHLVFFFIPITVGVMTLGDLFLESGFILMLVLIISGAFGMMVTGWTTQLLAKRQKGLTKHESSYHDF